VIIPNKKTKDTANPNPLSNLFIFSPLSVLFLLTWYCPQ